MTQPSSIHFGSNARVTMRKLYPWDRLEKKGDYFMVKGRPLEKSLRAQASKQSKKRGVIYSVKRVTKGTKVILVGMRRL